ncbi:prostacyclin synthase-like [Synchiropus splendidus]|uniref:prostacyclin synthase-like n=1 Tax=Synchiropus splendidus TaxID=270530 RepID=UPI00237DA36B|nr:prostacyclin synthase-like [Synchiropus splendidus]
MIWTVLLLALVLLLCFIVPRRTRSKTEPPLDKGVVPWLGHALEFGKDASKFLARMRQKHGDIFTVCVAGHYVTVLLDPHSYDAVLNDSGSLDFTRYAEVLMDRIFNLRLSHQLTAKAKVIMKQHFQGMNFASLNAMMRKHLRALLTAEMPENEKDWKEDGLFNFSYRVLFKAGYLTLFGGEQNNNNTDPSSVYEEYRRFDQLLTKLARGTLKAGEKREAQSVKQRLWEFLAQAGACRTEDSDTSPWLHAYRRLLQDNGTDEEMERRAVLMQLWATQGNAGPAAFWLLGFLLTHPDAMDAVKAELSGVTQMDLREGPPLGLSTPVFDSALEETLRLTAAPFITREVLQQKTIHMADGKEYQLRKGDRLVLFPFNSPQMDPEVHHEPQKFKYDRFLKEDGSAKTEFYKGGRRLKHFTMPWGAGTNGCVGRQFAINTIRQFVYMILTEFELRLCDPRAQMPEVDPGRYGFGMLQPQGDVLVTYTAKTEAS